MNSCIPGAAHGAPLPKTGTRTTVHHFPHPNTFIIDDDHQTTFRLLLLNGRARNSTAFDDRYLPSVVRIGAPFYGGNSPLGFILFGHGMVLGWDLVSFCLPREPQHSS